MARSKTPSFILELPLVVSSQEDSELLSRFQAGRQLYNACLGEAIKRMEKLKGSAKYKSAKLLPLKSKQRSESFSASRKQYHFTDYDLQAFATGTANLSKWIAQKIDSNSVQTVATRAFKAAERVLFGKAKKVRYKVPKRFNSIENKTNKQGLRWKNDCFVWGNLELKALIDWENPVHLHGVSSKVKYCRILKRELNGKRRWEVQLVLEGQPFKKPKNNVPEGLIGIDQNTFVMLLLLVILKQGCCHLQKAFQLLSARLRHCRKKCSGRNVFQIPAITNLILIRVEVEELLKEKLK